MPIHDWTRVPAGLFHDFHQSWTIRIKDALNAGCLPKGLSALVEQRSGPREADILTVERRLKSERSDSGPGAGRANRIVVRHHLGRIIAVIEILSPGNKDSRAAVRDFVDKTIDFLRRGIHILVVDLFPPTPRDPFGMHKVIWDEILEEDFAFPQGKDRIAASYESGGERVAYIEPIAVGDELPEMPLFLANGVHIRVPLEVTYCSAWNASPEEMRIAVDTGELPESDAEEE
ncbi:MAG TPA: DUF4058 domain-containing protein [Gemmataceae bacterium]|jgi:hypothetical protein|nr:DUF4058 domain-containing protein [Gemmataceae bacterium]